MKILLFLGVPILRHFRVEIMINKSFLDVYKHQKQNNGKKLLASFILNYVLQKEIVSQTN